MPKKRKSADDRSNWGTRTGFLLAAIGSAVGLGNIWRFPYIAYKNGGGAFLIPYIIAFVCVGITLMILEQGMGQKLHGSLALACDRISKRWEFLGWWPVIFVMFGIMLYYSAVISWCVNYLILSFNLSWGADTQSFFYNTFLGLSKGPFDFAMFRWSILIGVIFVWLVIWYIVSRGVEHGIERANFILMPLLFFLMIVLVVWSATLPGAGGGIVSYLKPDISRMGDPRVWSDAFSQIFFSLSLGFGIMTAYASYLPKRSPVVNNSIITCISNCGFEVFAGFAVFATIGYMAFASGLPISKVVSSGPGLAFITYPKAINLLPFGSRIFGVIFFSSLIFAGITSAISIVEAFTASVIDKFGFKRSKIVSVICLIGVVGSSIFTLGNGLYMLDIVDHFLNNYGLLCVGLLEAILIGWIFGAKKFAKLIDLNPGMHIGKIWVFLVRFVVPIVIVVLMAMETYRNLSEPYGGYSWLAVGTLGAGWVLLTLLAAIVVAKKKWRVTRAKLHELHHDLKKDEEVEVGVKTKP